MVSGTYKFYFSSSHFNFEFSFVARMKKKQCHRDDRGPCSIGHDLVEEASAPRPESRT